jgi:hypothetical protein
MLSAFLIICLAGFILWKLADKLLDWCGRC